MKYWWVNQKQTYRHEIPGGYLWSPKRNSAGERYRPYELMREICPGDMCFSYADGFIKAIGLVRSHCYEFPKPEEFGAAGEHWGRAGWRVDVGYVELSDPVSPKRHMEILGPLLPAKYSPLRLDGKGNQNYYLIDLSERLALTLASLIDRNALELARGRPVSEYKELSIFPGDDQSDRDDSITKNIEQWENAIEKQLQLASGISVTEKEAVIKARRGQGKYRANLLKVEKTCRITGVDREEYLVASHSKPWRDCETNEERLDPENGLMLTRSIDHLFDRGFISFENDGTLLISPVAHKESLRRIGVPIESRFSAGCFLEGQKKYLDWHREEIFLAPKL